MLGSVLFTLEIVAERTGLGLHSVSRKYDGGFDLQATFFADLQRLLPRIDLKKAIEDDIMSEKTDRRVKKNN